ncbi:dipeptidase [Microbacterium protaetiae]|uniref:Dipeptidase n=2 Tax=Microbacterium protaetiae TaxID=2509458 RepID=A0A4P6EHH7_9MICO|nr:dipeptidase [Microbacterium protaetiae]
MLMPELIDGLSRLAAIPSVSAPDFPLKPLEDAYTDVVRLLESAGLDVTELRVEGKRAPVAIGRAAGPAGAPTVLFYTHYDVVPAGDEALWRTPAFTPTERDGQIAGRGVADSKANILAIVGALRVFGGVFPVNVTVIIEGQEEIGSPFDLYPLSHPELFASDAMVIADVGSLRVGAPTLTVALRGSAEVHLEVRTLAGDKHSGQFGGAAPDARIALMHALATLHDEHGDVAVPGLRRERWAGEAYTDEEFRALSETLAGIPLQGTGGLGERIWSGPAITVTGFDAPPTTAPMNAVAAHAKATLNLRVHPRQDAHEAQQALIAHLRAQRPFGIPLTVTAGEAGNGVAVRTEGAAFDAAKAALTSAWGREPVLAAGGGSIPIVLALADGLPDSEQVMFGATDSFAQIHAPNERVLISELRSATLACALFLTEFAARSAQ